MDLFKELGRRARSSASNAGQAIEKLHGLLDGIDTMAQNEYHNEEEESKEDTSVMHSMGEDDEADEGGGCVITITRPTHSV
jgi:hypothetical protein